MTIHDIDQEKIMENFFKTLSYKRENCIDNIITENPFDFSSEWKESFLEASIANFELQYQKGDYFRKLCVFKDFDVNRLDSFEDIWDIPFILTDVFKYYKLKTNREAEGVVEFNSSGTGGIKSTIYVDVITGQRLLYITYHIYKTLGLVNYETPCNYLSMSYNPEVAKSTGTSQSDRIVSCFCPGKDVFHVLDLDDNANMSFLKEKAVEKLRLYVNDGAPIRILGFLFHTCETIRTYCQKYGKVEFPKDSYILSGGGWKNFAHHFGPNFDLFDFLKENTTIDVKNVRDVYSLNEHPVCYLQCEHHHFHVPNVALVCARDPKTLERLPLGGKGLLHYITPLAESSPLLSVLTTDYGVVEENCSCSVGGPYIKISGRAGLTHMKTCTITASEYV